MKSRFISVLAGLLFGLGLAISEMVNPARVVGFLDVTGNWDPTLLLVMIGAVVVTSVCFPIILKRRTPILDRTFSLPGKHKVDAKIVIGAALFGLGWGIAGLCPGPAIAGLVTLSPEIVLFVIAMFVGYWVGDLIDRRRNYEQSIRNSS